MLNREWEEFFNIEEVYDTSDVGIDSFTDTKKDAAAALASCINTNGCVDFNWMQEASGLSLAELIEELEGAVYQDPEVYDLSHGEDQGWMLRKEGRLYNAEEIYYMLICEQGNANEGAFDRHDLWQGIYDKARLQDDWNGRIRKAVKECGDSAGMPQSIRRIVQALAERVGLDWKQLLHDFIQFDRFDYNFLPPDRRYSDSDFYLPAYNVDEDNGSANHIWVCVDTSGSISEEELACAMAEILDAMAQAGLKGSISFFDSQITEPVPFETEEDFKKITPSGGGGTSFQIIFDYLREKLCGDLPRAILVFTDGYAKWPKEQDALEVPVLWLISREGKDDAPWGRVAKLRNHGGSGSDISR